MSQPDSRGATLLELVVALALVSIALLISGDLILASARLERRATSELLNPTATLAGVWLRRDVDNARVLSSSAGVWSVLPFRMTLQDGTTVEYDLNNGALVRRELSAGTLASVEQQLLHGIVSWRWRVRAGRVVDLEIRLANRNFNAPAAEPAGATHLPPPIRTETLTVARRGLAGGRTW
ncbi:MAG: prepilin-type N-terminal cleavage/methylation domain-containing protein [Acidobacteria bacterium]|jgi:prepilin-type N-terminal cleavage/methylation domain-containing protein|nr:prepilin-type N-terminal cleavage/methylation domain-containing protein [Acidobacteriota bacterium]